MKTSAVAQETKIRSGGALGRALRHNPALPIYLILAVTVVIGWAVAPSFRSLGNFANLTVQVVAFALAGIAQTFAILVGDVDLGVGGIISIVVCAAAIIMKDTIASMVGGALLMLLIGSGVGLLTGFLVTRIKVEAMVLTLAINAALLGFALYLMPFPDYSKIIPPRFMSAVTGNIGPIQIPVLGTLVVALIAWYVLDRTRFGLHLRAVGADPEAAFRAGIDVAKIKIAAHTITGFLAALTGLFLAARMGTGDPTAGASFSMDSMTAVIAGGTLFNTGVGGVVGTVGGAMLIVILGNIFNHLGVSTFYQYVFRGALLVVAVAGGAIRKKWQEAAQ
ncbi:MAG: ABC transporter permease [Chitinophagales bacterium]